MTDISKLRELLARVEGATEGGNELDFDICCAFGMSRRSSPTAYGTVSWWEWPDGSHVGDGGYGHVTTSIDAAKELCERVAGKRWFCLSGPHSLQGGRWAAGEPESYQAVFVGGLEGVARMPSTALCALAIRAKIAMLEKAEA